MSIKTLGTAFVAFCLGAAAFWGVLVYTGWRLVPHKHSEFRALNTDEMEWVLGGRGGPASYSMKYLGKDPDTGVSAMLLRYPAGQKQPPHTHSYGHGIYVLQGKLVTHRGTYGPGTYVWFPANEVIEHGASPDEDLVILFLRHEDMDINYVHSAAPH